MNKLKKIVAKLFWSENQGDYTIETGSKAAFNVNIGKLIVGTLEYNENLWTFYYSDDFKNQNKICPLTNFPSKEKTYTSKTLWPFFASRIPSQSQLQDKNGERSDLISLLKDFGRKTIANPFEVCAVPN